MKSEYDFSKGNKNPYAKMLKRQITINISEEVLEYFKEMSEKTSIPYQSLINFYLLDCVKNKKKIDILQERQKKQVIVLTITFLINIAKCKVINTKDFK